MELVLIAVLVVLLLGAVGLVVVRRREDTLEPPAPPLPREVTEPPVGEAPAELIDEVPPPAEELEEGGGAGRGRPLRSSPGSTTGSARPGGPSPGFVGSVLSRDKVDQGTWDDLEEALIVADVGVAATTDMLDRLRATVDAEGITEPAALLDALKAS